MFELLQLLHPLLNDVQDFRLGDHQDFLLEEHDNNKTGFSNEAFFLSVGESTPLKHQQQTLTCFSMRSSSAEEMLWLRCSLTVHSTQIHI